MNQAFPLLPTAPPQPGVRVFKVGLLLQLSGLIGFVGTIWGMQEAFGTLPKPPAVVSPAELSAAIGHVLKSTAIGMIGSNIGVLLCLFALWHHHLRRKWMFWTSIALNLLFAAMPCALSLLVFCLIYRHEFFPRPIKVELR